MSYSTIVAKAPADQEVVSATLESIQFTHMVYPVGMGALAISPFLWLISVGC